MTVFEHFETLLAVKMKRAFNGRGLLCAGTLLSLRMTWFQLFPSLEWWFQLLFHIAFCRKMRRSILLEVASSHSAERQRSLLRCFTIIYLLRNLLGEPILTLFPQIGFAASINRKVKRLKLVSQVVWYWNHFSGFFSNNFLYWYGPVSFENIGDKQPWLVLPQSKLRSLISYIRYYDLM